MGGANGGDATLFPGTSTTAIRPLLPALSSKEWKRTRERASVVDDDLTYNILLSAISIKNIEASLDLYAGCVPTALADQIRSDLNCGGDMVNLVSGQILSGRCGLLHARRR